MGHLKEFDTNIWILEGPPVSFFGFPYPTRSVIVKLENNTSWVWSPTELDDEIAKEIETKVGPVKHLVAPNKIHHLFLKSWSEKFPDAKLHAAPGLKGRKVVNGLDFDAVLTNESHEAYANDIDQVIFAGSSVMDEVVFFHKSSRTAIFTDLIQRFPEDSCKGFKGCLMKMDGLVGEDGSTPREWRLSFLFGKQKARESLSKINEWEAEKLIIAHGDCATEFASDIIKRSLSWVK